MPDDLEVVDAVHVEEGDDGVLGLPGDLDILVPDRNEGRHRVHSFAHGQGHRPLGCLWDSLINMYTVVLWYDK